MPIPRINHGGIEITGWDQNRIDIHAVKRTRYGKITVEDLEVVVKEITKTSLKGRLGKGGRKVSCRTSNGAIELSSLK
ncbi:MAG: hypothetical protein ABFS43_12165 [Thermodesulfobacteriota bacterium]